MWRFMRIYSSLKIIFEKLFSNNNIENKRESAKILSIKKLQRKKYRINHIEIRKTKKEVKRKINELFDQFLKNELACCDFITTTITNHLKDLSIKIKLDDIADVRKLNELFHKKNLDENQKQLLENERKKIIEAIDSYKKELVS